jgi:HTH-type transcriptional regulator/antitoxin HigA
MKTKWTVLTTEDEYDIALERTIQIFHAETGTPEGDELDIFIPLVAAYEDIHYPIPAPPKKIRK